MKSAYILFVGLFSVYIGQSILAPVLPPLVRELGLSELQGGLVMTFSSVMWVIFSPIWGRRSEIWGRKPVFLLSLTGYMLGVGSFGIVMQLGIDGVIASTMLIWLSLIATRLLVGMLFSGSAPSSIAYVADTTDGQTRVNAMGVISAAASLGTIIGPALGGVVVSLGLVAPIFMSAILPLSGVILVWIMLPPIKPTIVKGQQLPHISPTDPRLFSILAIGVTITTILSLIQFTIGYLFQDQLQLSAQDAAQSVSVALVAAGVATLFSQTVLIRALKSPQTLMQVGLPLLLAATLLLAAGQSFAVFTLALVLQGFGAGLALPGFRSAVTFAVESHEQGAAAGLTSSITGLGFIIGPSLGTGLYGLKPMYPYLFAALVLAAGIVTLVTMVPRLRISE